MTDTDRELSLQDEDRLPWLEAVEDDDGYESASGSKMLGFVLAALLALGLVVGGTWWLKSQNQASGGDGTLIASPNGDYKVKPDSPGGMKVEGTGDSTFAASEGAEANGKVNMNGNPEAAVAVVKQAGAAGGKPVGMGQTNVSTTVAPVAGQLSAVPMPATGGGVVQLGAYGSQAAAEAGWSALIARTPALAKLAKSVESANSNGRTVFRLRANAGTPAAASALCRTVGNCMVVR